MVDIGDRVAWRDGFRPSGHAWKGDTPGDVFGINYGDGFAIVHVYDDESGCIDSHEIALCALVNVEG